MPAENPEAREDPSAKTLLENIGVACDSQNTDLLLSTLVIVQTAIDGNSHSQLHKINLQEIQGFFATGELIIPVGTGTHGQRIALKGGEREISMIYDKSTSEPYATTFKALFDISESNNRNVLVAHF